MPKTSAVIFRVTPADRELLKHAAGSVPLSEWARSALLKLARRAPEGVRLSESFVAALSREAEEQVIQRWEKK